MLLIVLSFYLIFSLLSQVTIEKYFTSEDTFIIIFILWSLIGGIHLVYHKVKTKCLVFDYKFLVNDFFDIIFTIFLIFQLLTAYFLKYRQNFSNSNNTNDTVSRYDNFGLSLLSSPAYVCYTDKSLKSLIKLQSTLFILFWMPYFVTVLLIFNGVNLEYMHDVSMFAYVFGTMKGIAACVGTFMLYPDSRMMFQRIREFLLILRD